MDFQYHSKSMEKRLDDFGNSIRTMGKTQNDTTLPSNAEAMREVYDELLNKCEKYSKTITKLKSYMGKITKEYDTNIELLLQKLEKQKNDPKLKETVQKCNKKILCYKLKIRDLQDWVTAMEEENKKLKADNRNLKNQYKQDSNFKSKISRLKAEYETKMKQIMDEVKGTSAFFDHLENDRSSSDLELDISKSSHSIKRSAAPFSEKPNNGQKLKRYGSNVQINDMPVDLSSQINRYLSPDSQRRYYPQTSTRKDEVDSITVPSDINFKTSHSPRNLTKVSLLSHHEKLEKYKQAKRTNSGTSNFLKSCRQRISEVGKIRCPHCESSLTAKEYHCHLKSCKSSKRSK